MFGGWALPAPPPEDLTEKERKPPPASTQLDFPDYTPQNPGSLLTSASLQRLFRLLCSLTRPQYVTHEFLQILNLRVKSNASFGDLLPDSIDPNNNDPAQILHSHRLNQIIRELRFDSWDAFREVCRLPPLFGRSRIRLSHTRGFWSGLAKMSQYWDCSMDQYYEIVCSEEDSSSSSSSSSDPDFTINITNNDHPNSKPNNSAGSVAPPSPPGKTREVYRGRRLGNGSTMPPEFREETVSALVETVAWAHACQVRSPTIPPRLAVRNLLFPVQQTSFVGRIPMEREIGRRGLLEGPVMGICSRVETSFHDHSEDGKVDENVGKEPRKSRGGGGVVQVEGWKEVVDLAREVAVMLLLAQERARGGKEEIKPGYGKWWTSTPRWGGGPGGPIEDEFLSTTVMDQHKNSAILPNLTSGGDHLFPREPEIVSPEQLEQSSSGSKRKASSEITSQDIKTICNRLKKSNKQIQADRWKILRAGPCSWDHKMRYMKVGGLSRSKSQAQPTPPSLPEFPPLQTDLPTTADHAKESEPESPNQQPDTIYLVSSLNHHVALLSMQVSPTYLRWLAGDMTDAEAFADGLLLQRTRWFDMFNEEDRVQFVQGLWLVMDAFLGQ